MDNRLRLAAIRLRRHPWEWGDSWDVVQYFAISSICAFPWFLTQESGAIPVLMLGFVVLGWFLLSKFQAGRLHELGASTLEEQADVRGKMIEAGFELKRTAEGFLEFEKIDGDYSHPLKVRLFWYEGDLFGYAWKAGRRFHRSPLFSGFAEMQEIKHLLDFKEGHYEVPSIVSSRDNFL